MFFKPLVTGGERLANIDRPALDDDTFNLYFIGSIRSVIAGPRLYVRRRSMPLDRPGLGL